MPKKKKKKSWKERERERQIKQQSAQKAYQIQSEREGKRKPRQWPKGKILVAVCLLVLIFGAYGAWQYTKPSAPSDETPQVIPTSGVIYIKPDGQVEPSTAPILNVGNSHYTFTDDIYNSIIIERDNIVVDGANRALQGTDAHGSRGIDLTGRSNVTIANIKIKDFGYGVYLSSASNNVLSQNDLTNNYCGIWLVVSSNSNIISGNNIANNEGYAIWLKDSSNNNISENKFTLNSDYCIYLGDSNNNTVSANYIANNDLGIYFYSSSNNIISGNNIANNERGIHLSDSSQNTIDGNNIKSSGFFGIGLSESSNNRIYHNNFINNYDQVFSSASTNVWDNGYPSGGNYWSDYEERYPDAEERGGSGIWDTQYVIDENNQDNYPLMNL
jgi:parallel beta-helix repeat protein